MIPNAIDYPIFEANQVLTNVHLNSLLAYLDEQNRLTRATLHGIGVVCGLEVSVPEAGNSVVISKGYGLTSEGYLAIVGNEDFVANRYREYKVPGEDGYGLLSKKVAGDNENKYPLIELLNTGHSNYADGKVLTPAILQGKALLLFVEMPEENLKNCSPSSCDDKGKNVEITLRMLLIAVDDLAKLNLEIADNVARAKAVGDFFPNLTARLNLPDLRLPRLSVPASNMVDAQAIFAAYRKILSPKTLHPLFTRAGAALDEAYAAFKPLLPTLPADNFLSQKLNSIRALYDKMAQNTKVVFSQYFYDFLDDLLQAYEEFRWKAVELMALCIPPEELFPRHLELGEINGANFAGKKVHRHYFRPSPAATVHKKSGQEVVQLFQRLRLLVECFDAPKMPDPKATISGAVKIIPSRLGDVALSQKAIPYYYKPDALLPYWNFQNTCTGRPSLSHGYHVETKYHRFVAGNPLEYDTEKFNFYRIEGHVGLDWRKVLKDLLDKIKKYRLPFDVVALNAHPATVTAEVLNDPLVARCLTNDLQVIFDAWTKELECMMADKIRALSDLKLPRIQFRGPRPTATATFFSPPASLSGTPLKVNVISSIVTTDGTLGKVLAAAVESTATSSTSASSKPTLVSTEVLDSVRATLKEDPEVSKLSVNEYDVAIGKRLEVISAMVDFTSAIPSNASDLQYSVISDRYQHLEASLKNYIDALNVYVPSADNPVITSAEKDQTLKALQILLNNCLIKRLEELGAELERRKKQVQELLFFSKYVRRHPGIEHKAGVPKGGTFILVFQEVPNQVTTPGHRSFTTGTLSGEIRPVATSAISSQAAGILADFSKLNLSTNDWQLLSSALSTAGINLPADVSSYLGILTVAGAERDSFQVPDGVVIADFYLPYRCCSDCPPVQFVLPSPRPVFSLNADCANENGEAIVHFEFEIATPPCEVKVDEGDFIPLIGNRIRLNVGKHSVAVRDIEGGVSLAQEIEIFPRLLLNLEPPVCDADNKFYTVRMMAIGGKLPLFMDDVEVVAEPDPNGNPGIHFITVGPLPSGVPTSVKISDSSACEPQIVNFEHACIPFVTNPDEVMTPYNSPVTIDVLANDTGSGLVVTNATLPAPTFGAAAVNADSTITYTPGSEVEDQEVEITYTVANDAGDTKTEKVTVRVGKRPCDLPCEGKAVNCGYYFWVQQLSKEMKLTRYEASIQALSIEGKNLLADSSAPPVSATAGELADDPGSVMAKWFDAINAFVSETIGSNTWILKHEPKADDLFTTFRIERFACQKFTFKVSGGVSINDVSRKFNYTYSEDGTYAVFDDQQQHNFKLPAFDCIDLDKCNPDAQPEPRCKKVPFEVDFEYKVETPELAVFHAILMGEEVSTETTWLWEFQNGIALTPNEQETKVIFTDLTGFIGWVRVVAIDKNGCLASRRKQISFE